MTTGLGLDSCNVPLHTCDYELVAAPAVAALENGVRPWLRRRRLTTRARPRTFGPQGSGESRGGHARRERLPEAGLRGSHRRWATRHSLSGRKQGATARHVTTPAPERYFSTEWPERR